jgi:hypothetical protein
MDAKDLLKYFLVLAAEREYHQMWVSIILLVWKL